MPDRTIDALMAEINEELVETAPGDITTTNRLLAKLIEMTKMGAIINGAAVNWDTYEVQVFPGGSQSSMLCQVDGGDVVIVSITNWDRVGAEPIYYGQDQLVQPPKVTPPSYKRDQHLLTGYPLNAGKTKVLVLESSLYAVLDIGTTLNVPVMVERSRIRVLSRTGVRR